MKAALKKEEWEKLDDAAKAGYKQDKDDEDVYVLIVEEALGHGMANVKNLTGALSKERSAAEAATKKLAEFGDMSAKEAKEAILKFKDFDPGKDNQKLIDEKVKEAITHKDKEIDALKTENVGLKGKGLEGRKDKAVSEAISHYKAKHKLLELPLRKVVDVRDVEGKETIVVLNENGEPAYGKDGKLLTPTDYVGNVMKSDPDYAPAFPSTEKGGGGAGGETVPGVKKGIGEQSILNPQNRLTELRAQES